MRKVLIKIIMIKADFLHYQLQCIAKSLIATTIINGLLGFCIKASQKWLFYITLLNILMTFTIRYFFCKRADTIAMVKIDINDCNVIIPKGAILTRPGKDDFLFETVCEHEFKKEENNEN